MPEKIWKLDEINPLSHLLGSKLTSARANDQANARAKRCQQTSERCEQSSKWSPGCDTNISILIGKKDHVREDGDFEKLRFCTSYIKHADFGFFWVTHDCFLSFGAV